MKCYQAYRFRIEPNGEQRCLMQRFAGCRRYVYNRALALQEERYAAGKTRLSRIDLCKLLVQWKRDPGTAWLGAAPAQAMQGAIEDLDRAYKNFFASRAKRPVFKKKFRGSDSFRFPQDVNLDQPNARIRLPKIGWVRYRKSREVLGKVKNVTVSFSAAHWFVSIQTEREVPDPVHPSTTSVGIDVGVKRFATLSDGTVIEPLNSFRKHEKRLAKAQRSLARKVKFSNNWKKQKKRIARIYHAIANARRDFLHKASTTISKNHAVVVVEDLNVAGMTKSARGTAEKPGKKVKAKSGLNKSILDQGWGELRAFLAYKLEWLGGQLVAVAAAFTSQKCSACGHVCRENRRSQASFKCVSCGHAENADLNAAKNILAAGLAVAACGGTGLPVPVKQEPIEAFA